MELQDYVASREIFLMGEIDTKMAMDIISKLEHLASLSTKPITLYINSRGGSVIDGLAIYDAIQALKQYRIKVKTICIGCADSMAAWLLAAGTKGERMATPHAEIMIHEGRAKIQGGTQCSDIERTVAQWNRLEGYMNELLAQATGQPVEKIASDCQRDYYMDTQEAITYGLIDKLYNFGLDE